MEPALLRQIEKVRLITSIQHLLLQSVEAEKSAVLATTDAESQTFARDARGGASEIDRLSVDLRKLVADDRRSVELEKLDAFDETWMEFKKMDARLLALAVANTNLKAARLSATEGVTALDRFVNRLAEMQQQTTESDAIRRLSQASVAALRVQALVSIHIPAAEDAEMTTLEHRIGELAGQVEALLQRESQRRPEQIESALEPWNEYRRSITEVLRLSRQNTNIRSSAVSIHEKRRATRDCLSALSELLAAVESGASATR